MSNITITNLPVLTNLSGSAQLNVVQSGTSYAVSAQQIANLNANNGTVTSITAQSPLSGGTITTTGTIGLNTNSVSNSYLSTMPANTIKGNNTGSAAQPQDLSVSQTMLLLGAAPLNSPAFTGTPTAPTPSTNDSSINIATTAYVQAQGYASASTVISSGTGLAGGGSLAANRTLSLGAITNNTILANTSGYTEPPVPTTLSALLDSSFSSTQGAVIYRSSNSWTALSPGSAGQVLASGGSGSNLSWLTLTGTGTVQQINTGTGLTGGPITTIGTISIASTGVSAGSYGSSSSIPTFTVNAQGQLTLAGMASIVAPANALSGTTLNSTVVTSSLTSVGTLASGVWNASTIAVPYGGTGNTSFTSYGVLYGNSTSALNVTNAGTTGQVLVATTGGAPTWGAVPSTAAVTSFSAGTTGLTPNTATTGAVTLSGTLATTNGGTGLTSFTSGGAVYATSTSALTTGTLPIASGGTGITSFGTGVQTALGQAVTGSGGIVLATSPTLVTPTLGAATATSVAMTTGTITTTPSNSTDIANKAYVDAAVSNVNYHAACEYATTADLGTVTYNNGSSGVGATITKTSPFATLAIDGANPTVGQRILVKNETSSQYNGIYTVTSVGSGSVGWVLTRATDYDQTGSGTNEIAPGDTTFIISGSVNAGTQWIQTTDFPITIGTTPLVFVQIAGPGVYTAGTGLTLSGNTFSITNTAVSAGSYGGASSVPSFTVNAQGQLTAASATAVIAPAGTLSGTTLNSTVVNSSLTSVGTIGTGVWQGTTIGVAYGGTGLTSTPANGALDIGNGTGFTRTTLTQGSGISITNGSGSITIANSGVTSFSAGTTGFTPSSSTSGAITLAGTLATTNGGTGLTSFTSGGAVYATSTSALTTGTLPIASGGTGITSFGTGVQTALGQAVTGSGGIVLASSASLTSPTLTTPSLGVATATSIVASNGFVSTSTYGGSFSNGIAIDYTTNNGRISVGSGSSLTFYTGGVANTATVTIASTGIVTFNSTGAIVVPTGTTSQEPATPATGMLRFNTTTTAFEGYNGSNWTPVGGGASGGGTDQIFWNNGQTVNSSYSIPANTNAGTFGPVSIASGATVTVPSSSTWTVV